MNTTTDPSMDEIIQGVSFRIKPAVFTGMIFTFLALSIVITMYRIYLRIKAFGRLGIDDYFMIAAVLSFAASVGVTQWTRDLLYLQMAIAMIGGQVREGSEYDMQLGGLGKLDSAQYMLEWFAIYCVKFSYLFFFRPLVKRIRFLEIWWKVLLALLIAVSLPTIFLSLWVCPHYDESYLTLCVQNGSVYANEQTLLTISTANDIATDLLVISIPLYLLTKVQLELRRKLALGVVLCLSVFMIIIASIRYGLCTIYGENRTEPDSVWLFFWQSVECFVAISMVSLTAFRSLYGQTKKSSTQNGASYDHALRSVEQRIKRLSHSRSILKSVDINVTTELKDDEIHMLEKPQLARTATS